MIQEVLLLVLIARSCFTLPQYDANKQNEQKTPLIEEYKLCDQGYACVPWQTCAGVEKGKTPERPSNYEELRCAGEGNMCCTVSTDLLSSIFEGLGGIGGDVLDQTEPQIEPPIGCGHSSYECVPYFQCVDGVINTDGSGLIDVRTRPPANCINPEFADVPAVCCLIPGAHSTPVPIETCPKYQECVDFNLCSSDGNVITDGSGLIDIRTGYTSCYLPSGVGGRCCTPPALYFDTCPGDSVCTLKDSCQGQALDALNQFIDYSLTGSWSLCSKGSSDGVCCIPPPPKIIDKCPGESVCLQPQDCLGTALNEAETFVDYTSQDKWTYCSDYEGGVCCINPYVKPPLGPASQCGVRNYNLDERITGKIDASLGEFPWQAIIFYQNFTFNCGATLISHKHVLTAAHCVKDLKPTEIKIRVGEWQVKENNKDFPYIDVGVHSIKAHPRYNPRNLRNDIAIIELLYPLEYQYHINTICLPHSEQSFKQQTCIATGWGKDSFSGQFQPTLKKIELPFVPRKKCQNLLRKTRLGRYFHLHNSFVCAGGEENKDACYGDGGGPLVCKDKETSQYVLAGITSWGIGCGTKDVPGVYVNIRKYVDWIKKSVDGSKTTESQQQKY